MYLTLLPVLCCEMSVIFVDECEMFVVPSVLPSRGNASLLIRVMSSYAEGSCAELGS